MVTPIKICCMYSTIDQQGRTEYKQKKLDNNNKNSRNIVVNNSELMKNTTR